MRLEKNLLLERVGGIWIHIFVQLYICIFICIYTHILFIHAHIYLLRGTRIFGDL